MSIVCFVYGTVSYYLVCCNLGNYHSYHLTCGCSTCLLIYFYNFACNCSRLPWFLPLLKDLFLGVKFCHPVFWFRDLPWYNFGLYWGCFLSIIIFKSLTKVVNLSIQSLFLSNVSIASKVTPFFCWFWVKWQSLLLVAFMNGVEDCLVNCLSSLSFVSTLLAKSIASLKLFTLIRVE